MKDPLIKLSVLCHEDFLNATSLFVSHSPPLSIASFLYTESLIGSGSERDVLAALQVAYVLVNDPFALSFHACL